MEKIFNNGTIGKKEAIEYVKEKLSGKVPFLNVVSGCLGDDIIMLLVSFEKKEDWNFGYVENSNYFRMMIDENGISEVFTQSLHNRKNEPSFENRVRVKFRKCTVKSLDVLIEKIMLFFNKVEVELAL